MFTIRFLLNPLVLFIYLCVCFYFKSPIIIFSGSVKMQSSAEEGCGERIVFQTILSGKSATRNLSCLLGDRSSLRQPGLCFPVCSDPPQPAGLVSIRRDSIFIKTSDLITPTLPQIWGLPGLPAYTVGHQRRRSPRQRRGHRGLGCGLQDRPLFGRIRRDGEGLERAGGGCPPPRSRQVFIDSPSKSAPSLQG